MIPEQDRHRLRVLVVDAHPVVRQEFRALLSEEPAVEVVGEADGVERALEQARELDADMVVLRAMDGIDAAATAVALLTGVGVVVLPGSADRATAAHALRVGALGRLRAPLTEREMTVLDELARGKGNKEIARDLELRQETVKTHVKHILRKLGVQSRTEAAVRALTLGLLRQD